jgi:serine/threonine-protein kinase
MRIGKYEFHERLGNGAMGEVYRGTDISLDREVAIKALRPDLAGDPALMERFRSEARTAAKLHHLNVASVYAFEEIEGRCLLVMEFVPGRPMDKLLREFGPMSSQNAVNLMRQILSGIGHAHSRGIAHRDIKPANVFVTHDGAAKVLDFGIARILGTARQTREGNFIGTCEYMAPERILNKPTDLRSDIYSLGILLYEMLAGKLPFEGQSDYELIRSQVERAAPKLEELGIRVPAGLQWAVQKAIEKDPSHRFQTVGEFDAAIAPFGSQGFSPAATGSSFVPDLKHTRMGTASELAALESRPSTGSNATLPFSASLPGVQPRKPLLTPVRMATAAVVLALGVLGWVAVQRFSDQGSDSPGRTQESRPVPGANSTVEAIPNDNQSVPHREAPKTVKTVSSPGPDEAELRRQAAERDRLRKAQEEAEAEEQKRLAAMQAAQIEQATRARAEQEKATQIRAAVDDADRQFQSRNYARALSDTTHAMSLEGNPDGARDSEAKRERDKIRRECGPIDACQTNASPN